MANTSTFQLPTSALLHAQPQHEKRNIKDLTLPSTSPLPPFDKHTTRSLSIWSNKTSSRSFSPVTKRAEIEEASFKIQKYEDFPPHAKLGILEQGGSSSRISGLGMGGRTRVRPRGESDLGSRPTPISRSLTTYQSAFAANPLTPSLSSFNAPAWLGELLTGALIPLPFLLASLAYPALSKATSKDAPVQAPLEGYQQAKLEQSPVIAFAHASSCTSLTQACALSASALLLVGVLAKIRVCGQSLDRRKGPPPEHGPRSLMRMDVVTSVMVRQLSIGLPYYASLHLGGLKTAFLILLSVSSGLSALGRSGNDRSWGGVWGSIQARKLSCAVILLFVLADFIGLTAGQINMADSPGYLAVFMSAFVLPLPSAELWHRAYSFQWRYPKSKTSSAPTPPTTPRFGSMGTSPLISSAEETNITLLAGTILAVITMTLFFISSTTRLSFSTVLYSMASSASAASLIFYARPLLLHSSNKAGVALGFSLVAVFSSFYHSVTWTIPLLYGTLCALGYLATLFDNTELPLSLSEPHNPHNHKISHKRTARSHSLFTSYLLGLCSPGSILDTILRERDTRRIAYFAWLNLGFMMVQFFYGFVTGSLGLLTDSIHMLFDCLGLAVGLAAAVMSKWPPTMSFPYGYGKIDTLSGFANGIFLILVSIEIVFDATHRLREGHELRRLNELLIISILGFLVNIVGLTAFGHAHHGHGHDHSHGHNHPHSHSHSHSHSQSHSPSHSHTEEHVHSHEPSSHTHSPNTSRGPHQHEGHDHQEHHNHDGCSSHGHDKPLESQSSPLPSLPPTPFSIPPTPGVPSTPTPHAHSHDHSNENMEGIFLHILADALGSVAVIISTLLTKYDGWSGWDPLASCAIAILIFFSAIPLVKSSGMKLLLALPNELEYACRDTMQGVSELRGVVGYAGVRFWVGSTPTDDHGQAQLMGVVHVIAARGIDLEDLRERTTQYLKGRAVDAVVHVEREGNGKCWCGGTSPSGRP